MTTLRLTPPSSKPPSGPAAARDSISACTGGAPPRRARERERDRAAELTDEDPELVAIGEAVAHRQLLELGGSKPASASNRVIAAGLRLADVRSRLRGRGAALPGSTTRPRAPSSTRSLALRPDREGEPAAPPEHTPDLDDAAAGRP